MRYSGGTALLIFGSTYLFSFMGALSYQQALKRAPLSFVYPFLPLVQPVVLFYAWLFLDEPVSNNNIVGLILMIAGLTIITTSRSDQ